MHTCAVYTDYSSNIETFLLVFFHAFPCLSTKYFVLGLFEIKGNDFKKIGEQMKSYIGRHSKYHYTNKLWIICRSEFLCLLVPCFVRLNFLESKCDILWFNCIDCVRPQSAPKYRITKLLKSSDIQ